MSEFGEEIIDRLPANSPLKNTDNSMNKIIQNTIGEWLDNYNDEEFYEQIFIQTATGGYLDLIGRQYGVYRRVEELDEDYRQRIIYETIGHLTVNYLDSIYNVSLFVGDYFDAEQNTLISGNPYVSGNFIGLADSNVQKSLSNKFILDNIVYWINEGKTDYIIDVNDKNIIRNYNWLYTANSINYPFNHIFKKIRLTLPNAKYCSDMFSSSPNIVSADLNLPNAINCFSLLWGCGSITDVNLTLTNATNCVGILNYSPNVVNVKIDMPNVQLFNNIFGTSNHICTKLENIDLTLPHNKINDMITYIESLGLQYLETLIINGEEVPL